MLDTGTPTSSTGTRRPSGRRGLAAAVAVGAVVLLAALAHVALSTLGGQRVDERAMEAVVAGRDTQLAVLSVLGRISIGAIVIVAIGCVALALFRRQLPLAAAAVAVLLGANVTTQVLKHGLLERAELLYPAMNSLPSGHTTVVAAAVGAVCLVTPRPLRVVVVPLGAFAITLTGAATVVAGWHRPSDVIAAVLVALAWTAAASFVVGGERQRVPGLWLGSLVGAAAGVLTLIVIGVRPAYGWSGFADAALVLGVVSLAVGVLTAAMEVVAPNRS